MIRRVFAVAVLLLVILARSSRAQAPTFEYGELVLISAGDVWGATWLVADSGVPLPRALPKMAETLEAWGITPKDGVPGLILVMNKLGSRGWELVAVQSGGAAGTVYLFKRRRS